MTEKFISKTSSSKKPNKTEAGRYELTLSEFPVFLLSKRSIKTAKGDIKAIPIEYEDTITGKDGEIIKRQWKIWPDSKHGHGTASTFSTLFELFQIWKEQDYSNQHIEFGSIYNLLKRKGMNPTKQAYDMIKRDLDCLIGIRIEAKNAFWDNEVKKYVSVVGGFHLFDNYYIYDCPPQEPRQLSFPLGSIKANDVLFKSVLKKSLLIADFTRDFFYSLTPIEQRLALYLNKIFKSQMVHRRKVLELASQIPIYTQQSRNIKQKIKRASDGLIQKGFCLLDRIAFEKTGDKDELVVFYRRPKELSENGAAEVCASSPNETSKEPVQLKTFPMTSGVNADYIQTCLIEDIMQLCGDEKSLNFYRKVARLVPQELIYQAISEVKEVRDLGTIKKSRGALFTKLIKEKAAKFDISL
jgi:hypothetical protein